MAGEYPSPVNASLPGPWNVFSGTLGSEGGVEVESFANEAGGVVDPLGTPLLPLLLVLPFVPLPGV